LFNNYFATITLLFSVVLLQKHKKNLKTLIQKLKNQLKHWFKNWKIRNIGFLSILIIKVHWLKTLTMDEHQSSKIIQHNNKRGLWLR